MERSGTPGKRPTFPLHSSPKGAAESCVGILSVQTRIPPAKVLPVPVLNFRLSRQRGRLKTWSDERMNRVPVNATKGDAETMHWFWRAVIAAIVLAGGILFIAQMADCKDPVLQLVFEMVVWYSLAFACAFGPLRQPESLVPVASKMRLLPITFYLIATGSSCKLGGLLAHQPILQTAGLVLSIVAPLVVVLDLLRQRQTRRIGGESVRPGICSECGTPVPGRAADAAGVVPPTERNEHV